jgi:hypothetical protein
MTAVNNEQWKTIQIHIILFYLLLFLNFLSHLVS